MINYHAVAKEAYGLMYQPALPGIIERHIRAMQSDLVGLGMSEPWAWSVAIDACEALATQAKAGHRNDAAAGADPKPEIDRVYRG